MAVILNAVMEILEKPTAAGVVVELVVLAAPLWLAVFIGVFVGWAWRPKWAMELVGGGPVKELDLKVASAPSELPITSSVNQEEEGIEFCLPEKKSESSVAVKGEDLDHLIKLVEVTDGGPAWQQMMEKNLPTFTYRAWKRDPENGPPQYRSSTIFEDATPEMVRDFFWDDEFRVKNKWDDMLLYHNTLEECPSTGAMLVHWIRKFPFFCSDREYIIGRRIWASGRTFYCVTKGVPSSAVPRRNKPRRVDLYYSSWCIRPVESRRGDGQLTACEVLLFHHEDMGIPWEIAKMGVKQGMWGCVKKIEPGLRAYQKARIAGEPLSRCAYMAQINTKAKPDYIKIKSLETSSGSSFDIVEPEKEKHWTNNMPKMLVIGGALALACSIDHGLITKGVIFGVARRFANIGKQF